MNTYAQDAADALLDIQDAGGIVTFPGAITGTAPVYDSATGQWSGGTPGSDATAPAVEIPGDPDRMAALKLVLVNPVTLMVAASGLAVALAPSMLMVWGGVSYSIKDVEPLRPDGVTTIFFTVIGSAG